MAEFKDIYTYLDSKQSNIAYHLRSFTELFLSELDESINYLNKEQQDTKNNEKNNQDLLIDYSNTLRELRNIFQEKFSISPDISLQDSGDNLEQSSNSIPTTTAETPRTCTLYDDVECKKPVSFVLDNVIYPANSWRDILIRVCEILAEKDNDLFVKMTHDPQIVRLRKNPLFTKCPPDSKRNYYKLLPKQHIYVYTLFSAPATINTIRTLLSYFNIDPHDVTINLNQEYHRKKQ